MPRAEGEHVSASKANGLIAALGIAQVVSWGTLYYSFSLFVLPMQASFGWSLTAMNGALTGGLLMAGLCAFPVGTLIDRHGGRLIMTAGSLGAALLLYAWSQVTTLVGLYLVWLGIGICMAAVLYEPIFVVLTYHFAERARQAITTLTLIAGFASTVFMPLIEWLLSLMHWREVVMVLAGCTLCLSLPIHALLVPARVDHASHASSPADVAAGRALMRERLRDPCFWGVTLWFTAYIGTASGLMFQLVPYLKLQGVALATILLAVALVGPSQVAGRLLLMLAGDRLPTAVVGAITTTATPLAVLLLILLPPERGSLIAFAVLFGAANGISTILRGVAPAEWLGREHYGRVMGAIAAPMMIVAALAPLVTAWVWSATGTASAMQWTMFALAVSGAAGFWLAFATRRKAATPPL